MNHNSFFKITFQNKENAIDFLRNRLPPELLKDIDLESLEISKDSFIDPNFKEVHSDMLFKVLISGKSSYIYLLLEHKSYSDNLTSFQLLKYMVSIWDLHVKNQSKKKDLATPVPLPFILPMVLYHGKEKWKHGTEFKSIVEDLKGWEKYQVNFTYTLFDFSTYNDKEIKGGIIIQLFTLLFKYINRDDFEEKLYSIIELLAELMKKKTALEYVEVVLLYLLSGVKKIKLDEIEKILDTVNSKEGLQMLGTIAEQLERKGYKKAMKITAKKRLKAKQEQKKAKQEQKKAEQRAKKADRKKALRTAVNMKRKGSDIDFISEVVEMDKKYLEKFFLKMKV
jgi:hypothetical protein